MILRVKFTKDGYLKYISHLDLMRLFSRAFNRGSIPIKYSEGFNPQPKLSIANPLALGISSIEEYMDIDLDIKMDIEDFIEKINEELPEGIKVLEAKYTEDNKSVSSLISWGHYEIKFSANNIKTKEELESSIKDWLNEEKIMIKKIRRKGKRITERDQDIKPFIGNIVVSLQDENHTILKCLLRAGDNGNLKPTDFIEAIDRDFNLEIDSDSINIKRLGLFTEDKGEIKSLL